MDNCVEKLVDNSEDNHVENKQDLKSQQPQWIETWAKYLLKHYSTASTELENLDEKVVELMSEVLLASVQGDSCIPLQDKKIDILQSLIVDEQQAEQVVAPFVKDQESIYLYRYWQLEQRLAKQVIRLKQQQVQIVDVNACDTLLTDQYQKQSLAMVAEQAFSMITGGPGTGKTYTLARIIAVLHQTIPQIRIAMAAPTGKAAQRMGEALQKSLSDPKLQPFGLSLNAFNPMTIHRLLGLGHRYIPRFHLKQLLPYDVIIVDEASMLDLNLATLLFEAVPSDCRLILLGDANQLASVEVGSVLADLQQVPALQQNRVNLVTSRRFKEGALIGKMAQFIQLQKQSQAMTDVVTQFEATIVPAKVLAPIELKPEMSDVIQLEFIPEHISPSSFAEYYQKLSWGFEAFYQSLNDYLLAEDDDLDAAIKNVIQKFDQYRILTAIRHGALGLTAINIEMEKALFTYIPTLFKQGDWYVGRPVMMTYNDYQLGLSNGDIGICFKHRHLLGQFEVFFPSLDKWITTTRLPKSIETAFALTIHKSQGSEFTHTALVLDANAKRLLSQELLYTAITRAKSVVSLLVDRHAFAQSLSVATTRQSGLLRKINI